MATFYGQLTTPQQPSFTFDKVYTSHAQLLAEGSTDEVMVGRYVLVTYGAASTVLGYFDPNQNLFFHSYTQAALPSNTPIFTNEITGMTDTVYENLLANDYEHRYYYYRSSRFYLCSNMSNTSNVPTDDPLYEYITNLMLDISQSLQPCHNSVFIKLYSTARGYYYREIASLNEYLPTMDFIIESPITSATDRRTPYLYKTGLTYSVHLATTPVYLLGPINEYNVQGFSPSTEVKKNLRSGSELEKGFFYQPAGYKKYPYNALDNVAGNAMPDDPQAVVDKYYLQTIMVDLGNTVADMWNIIYGVGTVDTTSQSDLDNELFEISSKTRDTTFNTTYDIAHGPTPGGKDYDSIRGIANTMIELIGYQGYEQQRNPYDASQLAYTNGTVTQYYSANQEPPAGFEPIYDRSTLRGLLAEGASFNQKMTELDATLERVHEDLDNIEELFGEEDDVSISTIYGLYNTLSSSLETARGLIGTSTDVATEQETATLWGIYNVLKDQPITNLITLIGASEKAENDYSILERVVTLENAVVTLMNNFEELTSYWYLDNDTLSTGYNVEITETLTATNENNKVRGAMWAK